MDVFMNNLQSLVNTILTKSCFSKLLDFKMHLTQDNICLDNTTSNNPDPHTTEYLST